MCQVSVFETTIRALGGMLGGYVVSGGAARANNDKLLAKAKEVGVALALLFWYAD